MMFDEPFSPEAIGMSGIGSIPLFLPDAIVMHCRRFSLHLFRAGSFRLPAGVLCASGGELFQKGLFVGFGYGNRAAGHDSLHALDGAHLVDIDYV